MLKEEIQELSQHLKDNEIENVRIIPQETASNARMIFTPMTIIVNEQGKVENVWSGLWEPTIEDKKLFQ